MSFVERYLNAVDLCYVQSQNDPENEPYRSKYAARKIFEELQQLELNIVNAVIFKDLQTLSIHDDKFVQNESEEDATGKNQFLIRLLLDYHIGSIFCDTDERSDGEHRLQNVLIRIEQALPHRLLNSLALNTLNQLILLRTSFENYQEAIQLAKRAEEIYEKSSSNDSYRLQDLIQFDSLCNEKQRREEFEQIFTHTLFYLAQIYGKQQDKDRSARYCRLTLERQLVLFNEKSSNFDALDWATSCATLSQYYMSNHDYSTARHCLLCADAMLANVDNNHEQYLERSASFKRCWIKYAVNLLGDSSERLLVAADRDVNPNAIIRSSSEPEFRFSLNIPAASITSDFVLDFEQARLVFLFAMKKIRAAKQFYVLDGFVSDHAELCQDTSQLYSKLIFFQSKTERKCKMHKRRIDLLSSLCEEISEEHYLSLVRQLLFELAECYAQLLELKLEENSDRHAKKIDRLANNGIKTFERFLQTMNEKKSGKTPSTYAEEYLRPVLLAHFYLARLHSKCVDDRLQHLESSLHQYQTIVNYVDRHPDARSAIEQELNICKEMTDLLPLKIDQLRHKS